ncbi:MAG: hypothetical protein K5883_10355 [Pseudobutyrivibrio sp.]|jgi:hypothetical protein|nr:hypothetical protein [Pseudobutyrivibrio sp.]
MIDWRLTNQTDYLSGKALLHKKYKDRNSKTDHDHCEFCLEKFGDSDFDLKEGYCSEDEYYWICPQCFNDFKEIFHWHI